MSASKPAPAAAPPMKPRSPVERMLVWGGIAILLALVGVEYTAKQAHDNAVGSLLEKIKAAEADGNDVKASDVKAAVGNKTPRVEDVTSQYLVNGAKRLEVYNWFSVSPLKKREMYVYYGTGEDADVVSVSTEVDTESLAALFPSPTPEQIEDMKKKAAAGTKPSAPADEKSEPTAAEAKPPAEEKPTVENPNDTGAADDAPKKDE